MSYFLLLLLFYSCYLKQLENLNIFLSYFLFPSIPTQLEILFQKTNKIPIQKKKTTTNQRNKIKPHTKANEETNIKNKLLPNK